MPFGFNLVGKSLYLYIDFGTKELVLGSSIGVSHHAWADSFEPTDTPYDYYEEYMGTTYSLGPIDLLIESNDGFKPYRFGLFSESDYLGFEFPWLLIPATFAGLGVWRFRSARRTVVA